MTLKYWIRLIINQRLSFVFLPPQDLYSLRFSNCPQYSLTLSLSLAKFLVLQTNAIDGYQPSYLRTSLHDRGLGKSPADEVTTLLDEFWHSRLLTFPYAVYSTQPYTVPKSFCKV